VAQDNSVTVAAESAVLDLLKGRVLTTLFYEPSTRTSASFDAAMQRLGGDDGDLGVLGRDLGTVRVGVAQDNSVTVAAESADGDAVVLRHPNSNSTEIAAKYSQVPVINGGNGSLSSGRARALGATSWMRTS
jgi:carbamoyl-phosphate synthase/aspartate carbamoyltransferase